MASDDLFLLEVNFEEPNDSANSEESNASPKSGLPRFDELKAISTTQESLRLSLDKAQDTYREMTVLAVLHVTGEGVYQQVELPSRGCS